MRYSKLKELRVRDSYMQYLTLQWMLYLEGRKYYKGQFWVI